MVVKQTFCYQQEDVIPEEMWVFWDEHLSFPQIIPFIFFAILFSLYSKHFHELLTLLSCDGLQGNDSEL